MIDHQSLHGPSSSIDEVKSMSSETINLNTRAHSYDPPLKKKHDEVSSDKPSASTPPPSNGIHIEKPIHETIFCPPKSTDFVSPLLILMHVLPNAIAL